MQTFYMYAGWRYMNTDDNLKKYHILFCMYGVLCIFVGFEPPNYNYSLIMARFAQYYLKYDLTDMYARERMAERQKIFGSYFENNDYIP